MKEMLASCTRVMPKQLHTISANKKLWVVAKYFVYLVLNFFIAIVLWSGCFVTWIKILTRKRVDPRTWTDCKLSLFLFHLGRQYSSTLLVIMSVEKCFAVYFPLKSKTVCNTRIAKWATGIVGVILAGYNILQFFDVESQFIKSNGYHVCIFLLDFWEILYAVDSVIYSFGPFVLMFMTNFAIVFKFMTAKCKSISTESTNQALVKAATRGTAMVVTVSVTFLLLTAPTAVYMALPHIQLTNNLMYNVIMNFTQYLNHSINGVLYCIVGSRFRNELLKILCRKKRPDESSASSSVRNTSVVTISGTRA